MASLVLDFNTAFAATEGIRSGVTRREAQALYEMCAAAHECGVGSVVEIGSYLGRSTIILAATGHIYAIDHHRGSAEHQPGQPRYRDYTLVDGRVNTYPMLVENLRRAGLLEQVTLVVDDHVAARGDFPLAALPISLLFADADHSEAGTRELIETWRPLVVGLIAFHDYSADWPGVKAAVDSAGLGEPAFTFGSLAVFSVNQP